MLHIIRTRLLPLALALCLACPTSGRAAEPVPAREGALTLTDRPALRDGAEDTHENVLHPTTFVCPPNVNPPRQPIPPGKKIGDLCPPGTTPLLFFGPVASLGSAVIQPKTFVCFPQFHQQPRPVPPGKKAEDLCPSGASAWIFSGETPAKSTESTPGEAPVPQPPATSKKSP